MVEISQWTFAFGKSWRSHASASWLFPRGSPWIAFTVVWHTKESAGGRESWREHRELMNNNGNHTTRGTPILDPHYRETLEGSFSAVSTPLIARVESFVSDFLTLWPVSSTTTSKQTSAKNANDQFSNRERAISAILRMVCVFLPRECFAMLDRIFHICLVSVCPW